MAAKALYQNVTYQTVDATWPLRVTTDGVLRPVPMAHGHIEIAIRYLKRITESTDDQVTISHAMWEMNIGPEHVGLKADDIEGELGLNLDYGVRTSLGHLEDVGLVEEVNPPGPDIFAIAEWMDGGDGEIVNGEVEEAAEKGIDALLDDLDPASPADGDAATAADGGVTLRSTIAEEFDLIPEAVEDYLTSVADPVDGLNDAVEAIEETDDLEVGDDYGKIAFIRMPYQYRLTEQAVGLYQR